MRGEEGSVQHDLVDRSADPTLADDDHRGVEQCGNVGVAQADYGPYARVARPLEQQEFVPLREFDLGGDDLRAEVFHDLPLNHLTRESAWNLHWREQGDRIGQAKDAAHQGSIFVCWGVVDGDPTLADWLHESRVEALRAECGKEPKRGGRLAAVLSRRGEEELPCARGAGHRTTPLRAARCDARSG